MRIEAIDLNSKHLKNVKELGRKHTSTLGFLPEGGFDDHAHKKQILVALDDVSSELLGYLLYRVAKRRATIVHLCISEDHRGKGVAKKLVDHLKTATTDLLSITLSCRRDYEATKIWPHFGFVNAGERPGRGKDPSILVSWVFSHGHPDLFTFLQDTHEGQEKIVIDANIFFDLADSTRPGFEESNSLRSDWIDPPLNLFVVDEINNDIGRCPDNVVRAESRLKVSSFDVLNYETSKLTEIHARIENILNPKQAKLTPQDESDFRHIAKAICGSANFFITRDEELLKKSDLIEKEFNVKVLRPSDLIINYDQIRRESEYNPVQVAGTQSKIGLIGVGEANQLGNLFWNPSSMEPKSSLTDNLRKFLSNPNVYECQKITDAESNTLALVVYKKTSDDQLSIPLLRVYRGNLAATLCRCLILKAVNDAISRGKQFVTIEDRNLNEETKSALSEEGFGAINGIWVKININKVLDSNELIEELSAICTNHETHSEFIKAILSVLKINASSLGPKNMAILEKILYPLKIPDADIPSFIIPIRPGWAAELFDESLAGQSLWGANEQLAFRNELVYYRSVKNHGNLSAPARILWYVSARGGASKYGDYGTKSIRACSFLDEIITDRPKPLFKQFERLGIYDWQSVFRTAGNNIENDLMALRFSKTLLFKMPVSLYDLQSIVKNNAGLINLQSPTKISPEVFREIYIKGTQMNES